MFFISGCDSVSAFYGKGKLKPFNKLLEMPEFISTFRDIGSQFGYEDTLLQDVQKFVCRLYNQSDTDEVNKARLIISRLGNFNEGAMPCTEDVLKKHLSRANYQAAIWRRALCQIIGAPDLRDHGWRVDNAAVSILWMDLPPAPDGILENVECACKSGCSTNRCSCFKGNLGCTSLCKCSKCSNSSDIAVSESEEEGGESDLTDAESDLD